MDKGNNSIENSSTLNDYELLYSYDAFTKYIEDNLNRIEDEIKKLSNLSESLSDNECTVTNKKLYDFSKALKGTINTVNIESRVIKEILENQQKAFDNKIENLVRLKYTQSCDSKISKILCCKKLFFGLLFLISLALLGLSVLFPFFIEKYVNCIYTLNEYIPYGCIILSLLYQALTVFFSYKILSRLYRTIHQISILSYLIKTDSLKTNINLPREIELLLKNC